MDENHLHNPLLPLTNPSVTATATATSSGASTTGDAACSGSEINNKLVSSNTGLALRLLLIILIGAVSIWANHEASKGFAITITNDMNNTPAGQKFSLFYVYNDEATRLVQGAANFATKILYPGSQGTQEKLIDQVDIQLANHDSIDDQIVVTNQIGERNKYVLNISPVIMEYDDFRYRIRKGIQRGMSKIMLFNQQNAAPKELLDGMVEYINNSAGFGDQKPVVKMNSFGGKCWEDKDPKAVAQILGYCETESEGFIGRLSQAMRDEWAEEMVDKALGTPANHFCESFRHSMMMKENLVSSYR